MRSTKEDVHKRIQVKNYAMETSIADNKQTARQPAMNRPKGSPRIRSSVQLFVKCELGAKHATCRRPKKKRKTTKDNERQQKGQAWSRELRLTRKTGA